MQAWEILNDNPDIGMLITDWNIPEMNGGLFFNTAQEEALCKNCQILLVAGENESDQIDKLQSKEINFLSKPIEILALNKLLNNCFNSFGITK